MSQQFLDTPIVYLKGIGPHKAEVLQKELGVFTFRDLLTYYPFRYIDRTKFQTISEISEDLPYVQLRGQITSISTFGDKRAKRLIVTFKDTTGVIDLVWFKGIDWISDKLQTQTDYIVFGRPTLFKGRFNISHPEIEPANQQNLAQKSAFQSVYYSTEQLKNRGFDSEGIRKLNRQLVLQVQEKGMDENLSAELIDDFKLISKTEAIRQIHFPDNQAMLQKAQLRLKFEELFYVQLKLLRQNKVKEQTVRGFV
ncbi:MAG: OB-fold nucleic acid binding domain-containing protein, partial [Bacteroidia bacterium]